MKHFIYLHYKICEFMYICGICGWLAGFDFRVQNSDSTISALVLVLKVSLSHSLII